MKILYAFQGTGNGHVARARDLVPRFASYGQVDVLIAGLESELDLGFPIKYKLRGLAMVYDKKGAVSYWNSLWKNNLARFLRDILNLPVKDYDLVVIDFEAVTSYACLIKGVKSLQLSHQGSFLSKNTPRPVKTVLHWEWVLRYMSPAKYTIGFHFKPYDSFILPPIIRQEIRALATTDGDHYTVYLPAYHPQVLVNLFSTFSNERFEIFTKNDTVNQSINSKVLKASVEGFKASLANAKGLICGAGFEAPAEARFLGKKVLVCPIKGQYEQICNGIAAQDVGIHYVEDMTRENLEVLQAFFHSKPPKPILWNDYAQQLVECIVNNAINQKPLDDISSLQVW